VVRVRNREKLREELARRGIMTAVHYPVLLHRQPAFRSQDQLSNAEHACREVLSLPLWPYLTEKDVLTMIGALI
jgi:dTDP-4-amino-4,6-dideoxygalactose transaminase